MTRTRRRCRGCHAVLDNQRDIETIDGTARRRWCCVACGTEVPAVVAEKLAHQRQNEPE